MSDLRQQLEKKLAQLPDVELQFYKETDLLCLLFKGRDIAHFHIDYPELDTRIPKKFAKRHRLGEPHLSPNHPNRSKNSIWRSLPYTSQGDVEAIAQLIKTLLVEEYST